MDRFFDLFEGDFGAGEGGALALVDGEIEVGGLGFVLMDLGQDGAFEVRDAVGLGPTKGVVLGGDRLDDLGIGFGDLGGDGFDEGGGIGDVDFIDDENVRTIANLIVNRTVSVGPTLIRCESKQYQISGLGDGSRSFDSNAFNYILCIANSGGI